MKNIFIFTLLAFALTGLLAPSTMSDVFSEQPENKPQACNNEQAKHVGNKHCDDGNPTQFTSCDADSDGEIEPGELVDHMNINYDQAEYSIELVEGLTGNKSDNSGTINNSFELKTFNEIFPQNVCS